MTNIILGCVGIGFLIFSYVLLLNMPKDFMKAFEESCKEYIDKKNKE